MTVGALFAGYGGIELAVHDVLDAEPAWFVEFDKAPSAILAHHWPGVPNYGDVTKTKWSPDCPSCGALTRVRWFAGAPVEYVCSGCGEHHALSLRDQQERETGVPIPAPVDIITGGSPCQDLSHAGKRAGMKAGTRSGLWASMCDAIDIIRPRLVIWENVRGALSAPADSAVEPCPLCVGDNPGVSLRALGRVLGDLAELGYDAAWYGLRAADVGAPHGRWRVFVLAWPQDADDVIEPRPDPRGLDGDAPVLTLLPTATDRNGAGGHGDGGLDLRTAVSLLPTPVVNDMGAGKTVDAWDAWDAWTERLRESHTNGNGHGASLSIEALRLLPTPTSTDHKASGSAAYAKTATHTPGTTLTDATVRQPEAWGAYAAAIERWVGITRPVPAATEPTGKGGAHRLSPRFVEWMQGLPDGHVADPAIGISRNDQLKALGNGVVPQQCAAALRHLLTIRNTAIREEAAA